MTLGNDDFDRRVRAAWADQRYAEAERLLADAVAYGGSQGQSQSGFQRNLVFLRAWTHSLDGSPAASSSAGSGSELAAEARSVAIEDGGGSLAEAERSLSAWYNVCLVSIQRGDYAVALSSAEAAVLRFVVDLMLPAETPRRAGSSRTVDCTRRAFLWGDQPSMGRYTNSPVWNTLKALTSATALTSEVPSFTEWCRCAIDLCQLAGSAAMGTGADSSIALQALQASTSMLDFEERLGGSNCVEQVGRGLFLCALAQGKSANWQSADNLCRESQKLEFTPSWYLGGALVYASRGKLPNSWGESSLETSSKQGYRRADALGLLSRLSAKRPVSTSNQPLKRWKECLAIDHLRPGAQLSLSSTAARLGSFHMHRTVLDVLSSLLAIQSSSLQRGAPSVNLGGGDSFLKSYESKVDTMRARAAAQLGDWDAASAIYNSVNHPVHSITERNWISTQLQADIKKDSTQEAIQLASAIPEKKNLIENNICVADVYLSKSSDVAAAGKALQLLEYRQTVEPDCMAELALANNSALCLVALGRDAEALERLEHVLERHCTSFSSPDHPVLSTVGRNTALLLATQKSFRSSEAAKIWRKYSAARGSLEDPAISAAWSSYL